MAIISLTQYGLKPIRGKIKIINGKATLQDFTIDQQRLMNKYFDKDLGIFVAETCARYMNPYIPMDTGALSQNYITEPYKVTYTSVYARRIFYGEGMNFSKEKHPLATARWDRATEAAKKGAIAREVERYIKAKGGAK